jgi:hypothetical protein
LTLYTRKKQGTYVFTGIEGKFIITNLFHYLYIIKGLVVVFFNTKTGRAPVPICANSVMHANLDKRRTRSPLIKTEPEHADDNYSLFVKRNVFCQKRFEIYSLLYKTNKENNQS